MTITIDQTNPLVYRSAFKDKNNRDVLTASNNMKAVSDCRICKHYEGHQSTCAASDVVRQIPESAMRSIYSCDNMIFDPNKRKKLL